MVRLTIASSCPVVREGLKSIMSRAEDFQIAFEAGCLAEVETVGDLGPSGILLIDLAMFGNESEFAWLQQLRRTHPDARIVALGVRDGDYDGRQALRAGAVAYLGRGCTPSEMVCAVRAVAGGQKHLCAGLTPALVASVGQSGQRMLHKSLSMREWQVFVALASGQSPSRLAQSMKLSVKTVSTYRTRILEKMKMTTTAQLMHYAIRNGLVGNVPPDDLRWKVEGESIAEREIGKSDHREIGAVAV